MGPWHAVTVSPKFQVVIPNELRETLGLLTGQKVQVVVYGDRIELIPVRPAKTMRGFLEGIDTRVPRVRRSAMNVVDSSAWLEYFANVPTLRSSRLP